MRGSPLLQTLALTVFLAIVGIPVWSLTRPQVRVVPPGSIPSGQGTRSVDLLVTASVPVEISLACEGKMVWKTPRAGQRFEQVLELPASSQELVVTARWAGAVSAQAVRLEFAHDGEMLADATVWGQTEAREVVTLP